MHPSTAGQLSKGDEGGSNRLAHRFFLGIGPKLPV